MINCGPLLLLSLSFLTSDRFHLFLLYIIFIIRSLPLYTSSLGNPPSGCPASVGKGNAGPSIL